MKKLAIQLIGLGPLVLLINHEYSISDWQGWAFLISACWLGYAMDGRTQ